MPELSDHAPNPWFVCPIPKPGAAIRLFFFPYAGGGPAAFGKWLTELPGDVEGHIAHYPGRGARHIEPPINDLGLLVEQFSRSMGVFLDKPFAFFGHSLGALIAFELSLRLRRQVHVQPQILFVSACGAPHIRDPHPPTRALSDVEFVQALESLGGIPIELLRQPEILQLFLPAVRADLAALEGYHFNPDELPLDCPILALGGLADSRVSRDQLEGWAMQTTSDFRSQYFPGGHFFIQDHRHAIIASIGSELQASSHAEQ